MCHRLYAFMGSRREHKLDGGMQRSILEGAMITFQRILFPVDFSNQDHEAAPFVRAMAERFQSQVILLHVTDGIPAWQGYPEPGTLEPVLDFASLMDARKEQLCDHLAKEFVGPWVARVVEMGDPAREIARCVREHKIDLIMMPTHGHGPFRRFLLGSVAAKVLHDVACPVWTGVHTDQLWSQGHDKWRRFLCAVDADPRDAALLRWAAQFSAEQKAELRVIHAVHASSPIAEGQESPPLHDYLLADAKERLAKVQTDAGTDFEIEMQAGKVEKVVRETAAAWDADLILIGRGVIRGVLGGLRSEAYAIIREAPCPVISV